MATGDQPEECGKVLAEDPASFSISAPSSLETFSGLRGAPLKRMVGGEASVGDEARFPRVGELGAP